MVTNDCKVRNAKVQTSASQQANQPVSQRVGGSLKIGTSSFALIFLLLFEIFIYFGINRPPPSLSVISGHSEKKKKKLKLM